MAHSPRALQNRGTPYPGEGEYVSGLTTQGIEPWPEETWTPIEWRVSICRKLSRVKVGHGDFCHHPHPSPKAQDDTEEGAEPAQPKGGAKPVTPSLSDECWISYLVWTEVEN